MYQTIVEIAEIRECQEELQSILSEKLTEQGEFNIGFPGGSWQEKEGANWGQVYPLTQNLL